MTSVWKRKAPREEAQEDKYQIKMQPPLLLPLLLLPFLTAATTTATPPCLAYNNVYNSTTTASKGITELGIQLVREFRKLGTLENILISPFSLWSVLTTVLTGAEGESSRQIAAVVGLKQKNGAMSLLKQLEESLLNATERDNEISLSLANRIFIHQNFTLKTCKKELSSLIFPLNLQESVKSAEIINNFINESTKGLIPRIVTYDHLTEDTRMVLVNAVYFKGLWSVPFPAKNTKSGEFFPEPNSEPILVDMMSLREMPVHIGYSTALKSRILQLPYSTSKRLRMSIILPTKGGRNGIDSTLQAMDNKTLWEALNSVKESYQDVYMPKFEMKTDYSDDLKQALQNLGLQDIFTPAANLSSFNTNLYVKYLMHKAYITVTEEGSEAAAATGAVIATKISSIMRLDRSFIFCIHDKEIVLFMGVFVKP